MSEVTFPLSGTQDMEQSSKSNKSWNEFVIQKMTNSSNREVGFSEVVATSGYIWKKEGPSEEITAAALNNEKIQPNTTYTQFNPYGTRGTATGSYGSFRVRDIKTNRTVCRVQWECPYNSSYSNRYHVYDSDPDWTVKVSPWPPQRSGGYQMTMTFIYSASSG